MSGPNSGNSTSTPTTNTSSTTTTTTNTDSYNRTFNRVNNIAINQGDLSKTIPGNSVEADLKPVFIAAGVAAVGLIVVALSRKR